MNSATWNSTAAGAELLFQVLTEREEKNSVAIASNESFSLMDEDLHRPEALRCDRRPTPRSVAASSKPAPTPIASPTPADSFDQV